MESTTRHAGRMRFVTKPAKWLRVICSSPGGVIGVAFVAILLVLAALGPLIAPYGYTEQDIAARLEGPSTAHLLGTDQVGRDVLARVIGGTRIALVVGVPSVLIACVIGMVLGGIAAYARGWVDNVVVVIIDTLQAFPAVVLALLVLSLLGPSLPNLTIVIAVAFVPSYARITRAQVLRTNETLYVEAQRVLGAPHRRIIWKHVIPNIMGPVIVLMAMDIPFAIVAESGLSFLGLGVRPPAPSWGAIISEGFPFIQIAPWPVLAASGALMLTTLALALIGERLRLVLDPRHDLEVAEQ